MSDVERLLAAFAAGELVRPSADTPNLVDLARAVATITGVEGMEPSPGSAAIAARIGQPRHLVLVLADGLGAAMLEALPPDAFLPRALAMELVTVFPSTTAVGLTTLATGEWPARHGITGWWTYYPPIGGAATVVKFERRADDRSLMDLGIRPAELLPLPSMMPRMRREVCSLLPRRIAQTPYSCYFTGDTKRLGYGALSQGVDFALERIDAARGPTYTYLYTAEIDAAAHEQGMQGPRVVEALLELERQAERLAAALGAGGRVLVTADHGHLGVPPERRQLIEGGEEIASLLRVAPSYDPRVMCFHLRRPAADAAAFRAAVARRFGERIFLLATDEVEALALLGPGPLSAVTRERVGDFMAIVRGDDAIGFRPATGGAEIMNLASQHSGLTPEQMRIPLIVA